MPFCSSVADSPDNSDAEIMVRSVAVAALTVAFAWWVRIVREITRAQEKAAGFA